MNWYLKVLQNFSDFRGRARRSEYWYFALFNFMICIALYIVGSIVHLGNVLEYIYTLVVLVPSIAVGVRRLHDTGRSGWWLLIGLIPLLGWIALIIFFVEDGKPGANQWGPNPKEVGETAAAPA